MPDEIKKERNSKSKDKKKDQSWDENEMRKEKRVGRKRVRAILTATLLRAVLTSTRDLNTSFIWFQADIGKVK